MTAVHYKRAGCIFSSLTTTNLDSFVILVIRHNRYCLQCTIWKLRAVACDSFYEAYSHTYSGVIHTACTESTEGQRVSIQ